MSIRSMNSWPAEWVRSPVDELAVSLGCWFDVDAAERPITFIERFCRQSIGKWAGQPLTLLDWQRDFVRRLFGWKRADGSRRYRSAYLEVAKKNGKSTLCSGLTLFLLVADNEPGAVVFCNAYDREQASIVFGEAARMVRASPSLSKILDIVDSKKTILLPRNDGLLKANSADVPSKDGANAHGIIFDELHRQRDRSLWEIFEYADLARRQPLKISITTAGEDESGVWYEQRQLSERINRGENLTRSDIEHLGVVYRAEPTDDLDAPATWKKANPSLGVTIEEDRFRSDLEKARKTPLAWNNFLRLRLNIITRAESKFLPPGAWSRCGGMLRDLEGRPCYGGLDLATTKDLCAWVLIFPDSDGTLDVLARFWCPESTVRERTASGRAPYQRWVDLGLIEATKGNVVDYDAIREQILADRDAFDLKKVISDPFNATHLCLSLKAAGVEVEFLRQGFLSLNAPTKELERLVLESRIRHAGDPVLAWNMANAVAATDSAGNYKLDKQRSKDKIDGAAALVNALDGWLHAAAEPEPAASPYETRGLVDLFDDDDETAQP